MSRSGGNAPEAERADGPVDVEERWAFSAGRMILNALFKKAAPFLVFVFAEA